MKGLALCLCLLPLPAGAEEHSSLAQLIDALSRPDLDMAAMRDGLTAAGYKIGSFAAAGPEGLPDNFNDPFYYYFQASVASTGPVDLSGSVICFRVGLGLLPRFVPAAGADTGDAGGQGMILQSAKVPNFEPGAVAQLSCNLQLMTLTEAPLPTEDQVVQTLQPRFDTVSVTKGPDLSEGDPNIGWVLYPPLSATSGVSGPALMPGQSLIEGTSGGLQKTGRANRIAYLHQAETGLYSFDLVSHLAPQGS
ncbi:MAG: hypothetical protein WAT09_19975 [Paracoccaceae bacterium]